MASNRAPGRQALGQFVSLLTAGPSYDTFTPDLQISFSASLASRCSEYLLVPEVPPLCISFVQFRLALGAELVTACSVTEPAQTAMWLIQFWFLHI